MIRIILTALCAMLLLTGTACAETFSASTAYEARMKALDMFDVSVLTMEYPDAGAQQGHLIRWTKSIRIYVSGNPTQADRRFLDNFLMQLALRVPDMPNITITTRESEANMHVYYVPLSKMGDVVPGYREGNWGMFHFQYVNWQMSEAWVGIATDVTDQRARNHLIQEEIVGALGLTNDHYLYSDSIVYQPWTTVQELSEIDWIVLNMVYSPLVSPGMEAQELHRIFLNAWSK